MTIDVGTQRKVRVMRVTSKGFEVKATEALPRWYTLGTHDHLYLPAVGNYCIMEKTEHGWRILRRTLAP